MRIFVTGASGYIGSVIVEELVKAGHEVTGLVRTNRAARMIEALGATARPGSIADLDGLRRGAADADGVIHTAFFHALSHMSFGTRLRILLGGTPSGIVRRFMTAAVDADRRAIEALGGALQAGDQPLVAAFPTMAMMPGHLAIETDLADPKAVGGPRVPSERAALALAERGVRATLVRLPPSVHDETRQGLVTRLIAIARKSGLSAYVEDGGNRWAAVHRLDAARLFRLALERGEGGSRYHAVAESCAPFRSVAEAIGRELDIPAEGLTVSEAAKHFGWLAPFVAADNPVSSRLTQERLGWQPRGPALSEDIAANIIGARPGR